MSLPTGSMTRSQLIKAALATGALAACSGGVSTNPFGSNETAKSLGYDGAFGPPTDRLALVNRIFAHDAFAHLDKQKLLDLFDPSPHIVALQHVYLKPPAGRVQQGKLIQSIPSDGIVISTPGTYKFGGNLAWTPSASASAAITILSGNVTLDMQGFTLKASIADKSRQLAGVCVTGLVSPLMNVSIKNGTIASFTEYGVLAQKTSGLKIQGVTVTGLCMQNLSVRFMTPCGFLVGSSEYVSISKCSVTKTNVTTDSSAGFQIVQCNQGLIDQCTVTNLTNNDGAAQGFSPLSSTNVVHQRCSVKSMRSFFNGNVKTNGHTVIGYCPIFCQGLTFTDCSASDLTGCCDDCHGMSVFLNGQVTVSRFEASGILDGAGPAKTGAKATGLEVYGTEVSISHCKVSGIRAINPQDLQAAGFSAWGVALQFAHCSASDVSVKDDDGSGALGVGYGWAPDPRAEFVYFGAVAVSYVSCKADNCDVAFDTWYHVDSTWTNPTITKCKTGFLVQPGAKRTLTCDGCSECNPALSVTITNIASGNNYPH